MPIEPPTKYKGPPKLVIHGRLLLLQGTLSTCIFLHRILLLLEGTHRHETISHFCNILMGCQQDNAHCLLPPQWLLSHVSKMFQQDLAATPRATCNFESTHWFSDPTIFCSNHRRSHEQRSCQILAWKWPPSFQFIRWVRVGLSAFDLGDLKRGKFLFGFSLSRFAWLEMFDVI